MKVEKSKLLVAADFHLRKPCWLIGPSGNNTSFNGGQNKGFKKFSYMRKNGNRSVFRNVRWVTKFKDKGFGASFPDNGKNSFVLGA